MSYFFSVKLLLYLHELQTYLCTLHECMHSVCCIFYLSNKWLHTCLMPHYSSKHPIIADSKDIQPTRKIDADGPGMFCDICEFFYFHRGNCFLNIQVWTPHIGYLLALSLLLAVGFVIFSPPPIRSTKKIS